MNRDNKNKTAEISAKHLALCPLDGRYAGIGEKLAPYFSEYALVKNRVKVEVKWLKFLLENVKESEILESFQKSKMPKIISIYENFSDESFIRVKEIESVTNHDVKAVELFVDEKLEELGMKELISFVHIGCTSEDINNASYACMIKEGLHNVWIPAAQKLIGKISELAEEYQNIAMLAHTHGQPATPTTVGKELAVYVYRLEKSLVALEKIEPLAKFNGATGNYAAISVAFPEENWEELSREFIENELNLTFNPVTTQIESHDYIAHILDGVRHFNNVLCDLDVDMWLYISKMYFKQITVKSEVGSSTMPHKVNPIRFENSESNIDTSNGLLMTLSNKLTRSRMQRDLSDSSSLRNIGMALGYSLQAINQTKGGLEKVEVNKKKIQEDLDSNWEVLAEPIQTVLRKYGIGDAYSRLKDFTRGKEVSKEAIRNFVKSLEDISEEDKKRLLELTPESYVGYARSITREATLYTKYYKD